MKKFFAILAVALLLLTLALPAMAEVEDTAPAVTGVATEPVETQPEDEAPKTNFGFYPESLAETLPIMGMGMLGIFLVIGVIVLVVIILRATSKKSGDE